MSGCAFINCVALINWIWEPTIARVCDVEDTLNLLF